MFAFKKRVSQSGKQLSIYLYCNGGLRPSVIRQVFDECLTRINLFALANASKLASQCYLYDGV